MVAIGAFPIAKLGGLLVKQISKPIANALKHQAKNSPVFSKYVCIPPARFYNWCEVKAKMWVLHLGKPVNITVLNDEMAIELGANLLGESIIFIIASAILVYEYNRSSKKETAKEEAKRMEIQQLQDTLKELFIQTEEQAAHIRELSRKLGHLETRVVQKPWVAKKDQDEPKKSPPPETPPVQRKRLEFVEPQGTTDNYGLINNFTSYPINNKYTPPNQPSSMGLILTTVSQIENEFWVNQESPRKNGVVTQALNHIYHNVYKVPITFH